MKKGGIFKSETVGDLLKHLTITLGSLALFIIIYFYIYLPNATNHGDSLSVPNLIGLPSEKVDSILAASNLRYEISDSAFSDEFQPLDVIRQFPHAGSIVKPERKIFISINRIHPPTVPIPAVEEQSLINASAILKSNELKLGKVIYMPSPFSELVLEMRVNGEKVEVGTRVAKGTIVDLIVGDGAGPNDLIVRNLVGMDLKMALVMIAALNLHQGDINIPDDVDTTDIDVFVFKQKPDAGDSVRVGDPINLWLGPIGYTPKDSIEVEEENN